MDTNPLQLALIAIMVILSGLGTLREILKQGRLDAAAKAEELREKLHSEFLIQDLRDRILYLEDELRKCLGYVPHPPPHGDTHITVGRDLIGRDVTKRDEVGRDKIEGKE